MSTRWLHLSIHQSRRKRGKLPHHEIFIDFVFGIQISSSSVLFHVPSMLSCSVLSVELGCSGASIYEWRARKTQNAINVINENIRLWCIRFCVLRVAIMDILLQSQYMNGTEQSWHCQGSYLERFLTVCKRLEILTWLYFRNRVFICSVKLGKTAISAPSTSRLWVW